eukprot:TRINITY_DN5095_c0_g1_i2.p1 TRINITY_DN5095_c0_g1~~TRINITY_DN5095_c0_g1_i2.p1  ORF type:complete len:220 (+),score=54.14 TRINITY_DN5095_c0_g1_i2:42-662(+)
MPLNAGVVAVVGATVLSQHGLDDNLRGVVNKILQKIPRHDSKMSYEYPPMNVDFSYIVENRLIYLVANNRDGEKMEFRIPFTYLEEIKKKFKKEFAGGEDKYPEIDTLSEAGCREFDKVIKETLSVCNDKDKIKTVQAQIDDVHGIVLQNIEKVIDRGDKIDALVDKIDTLDSEVLLASNQRKRKKKGRKTNKNNRQEPSERVLES